MKMQTKLENGYFQISSGPLGPFLIAEQGGRLVCLEFIDHLNSGIPNSLTKGFKEFESHLLATAKEQLKEYFEGGRTQFELRYRVDGTSFQKQTWEALLKIRYGEIWCYQKQARQMGNPSAVRAVGQANGRNPLSIIIPCHRVIGKNGSMTGFSSGIERKKWLLKLESCFSRG